ncbi:carboxypeptidase-like regulatory domain-containing protein [Demequina lutea]|uniref:Carboxypeptidase regulatory-like domain-containing protein n=1 Tax=Demequina lutea TaxID=431489 RepID=A0A7Y9ZC65_9MICO|nr:carboxypeptidase-like regulatory domain-containing protein [Demequina lutea]NYI42727.1 hypothetical protein [Demequina lutea]
MSTDLEMFAVELRTSLDLEGLHSGLKPAAVLARGRRSARRRTVGMALGGVVAIAAVAVAAVSVQGLLRSAPVLAPAEQTGVPVASKGPVVDATVNVTVGLWGGPAQPTGGMALEGQPAPGVNVTARDTQGKTVDGTTDELGVAQLHLAPGAYVIFSTYCGPTEDASPATTVQSGDTRSVQIRCDVP